MEDAEQLIAGWNERQAKRMPMLFSPTIGAAITARYWFLWVRCPACRTTQALDLRILGKPTPKGEACLSKIAHSHRPGAVRDRKEPSRFKLLMAPQKELMI